MTGNLVNFNIHPFTTGYPTYLLRLRVFWQMDELTLSLTGGTNGYKVQLRELFVKGASNYTVEDIKLGSPFEAIVRMPALILDAHYSRFTICKRFCSI